MSAEARVPTRAAICAKYLRPCQLIKFGLLQHRASGRSSPILPLRRMGGVRKEVVGVFQMFLPFDGKRPLLTVASSADQILADGVAFTGEGKLVRKATGYEQEKLKPRYPTSGSRAARAELPAPIGAYR